MTYKVRAIRSIELSSVCNFKCGYCPYPEQVKRRPVGLMDEATFEATLGWVRYFYNQWPSAQKDVTLSGIGESLLHPNYLSMAARIREALPYSLIHTVSNGSKLTPGIALELKRLQIRLDLSDHDAAVTAKAVGLCKDIGLPYTISRGFALNPHDWAGQVQWESHRSTNKFDCTWLTGFVSVLSDGDITRCCLDAFKAGVFASVFDSNLPERDVVPFGLCSTCHHVMPAEYADWFKKEA